MPYAQRKRGLRVFRRMSFSCPAFSLCSSRTTHRCPFTESGMAEIDPTGSDWSDHEIDLIVADYFDMLQLERLAQPYVKAERNRAMQDLSGRSRGSIEFKHQNISAVLYKLGLDWILGYKPMANYQKALLGGIERYLDRKTEIFIPPPEVAIFGASEEGELFLESPPQVAKPAADPE